MAVDLELRALEQRCACLAALGKVPELEKLLEQSQEPCVRYYLALAYARGGAIDRGAGQVKLGLARNPDHAGLRALELRFQTAMPAVHVNAGARGEAAAIWEKALAANPDDVGALHSLANLTYWWAQQEEYSGGPDVDRLWETAIAYWTRLAASDRFWVEWRARLSQRWQMDLQDSDLQTLRDALLDERLTRLFENYISRYKEEGRFEEAARHDDYLTTAMVERGPRDSFTGALGKILILIEARGLPDKALERLAALPEKIRREPEARYLRVRALLESAKRLHAKRRSSDALRQTECAWAEAASLEPRWASIQLEVGGMLDSLGKQEATRLKQDDRIDEAINLLEKLKIRDYACIFYTDRGLQRLSENRFELGRADFERALAFDSEYDRAKKLMGLAFYHQALTTQDPEVKLKLLRKAIDYKPKNPEVRESLGAAYYEKALRIVKGTSRANAKLDLARAIGLLRAAATTVNPAMSEETLDAIVRTGDCSEDAKRLPEGLCRTALENLASVARHRRQVRSE